MYMKLKLYMLFKFSILSLIFNIKNGWDCNKNEIILLKLESKTPAFTTNLKCSYPTSCFWCTVKTRHLFPEL